MGSVATGGVKLGKADKFSPASKFISIVEYDPKENTMDITFHSGTKVRYLEVYPNTFLSFKQSPTFDSYYSRAIKGNLQSVKLVDNSIGRKVSTTLNKSTQEKTLNAGLRKQQSADQRIIGTVARAFAAI